MTVAEWSTPAWREEATAWLDAALAEAGLERTGAVEQPHLRPWSTVLTAPTTEGTVFLKASGPEVRFEAGLYELLGARVPERVLAPLAVDAQRGWVVLPDGGASLGEQRGRGPWGDAFVDVLPAYGELQRRLGADELLARDVADMRPARMPERFDEALAAARPTATRPGEPEVLDRVSALRERYAEDCARLAAAPGAASLDHNDLHPWNMLTAGDGVRFYDWGDAVVAHPFACLLVPLGMLQEEDGPRGRALLRARDAYLEVFSDLAPHAELVDALELACHVAKVARALVWLRALVATEPGSEDEARFADAPVESLGWLLAPSYLGGA